jgi:hypothetical protein
MSRAAWVQRALPDGSAINDSFTRQGWLFLRETNMNHTINQVRTLEESRQRQRDARKRLQQNWTRVLNSAQTEIEDEPMECNAPRHIPHAWQHLD